MLRQLATKTIRVANSRHFFVVVDQASVAYREFLGGNRIRLQPGLSLNLPLLHSTRVVSLHESPLQIKSMQGYTSDNVPIETSATIFYKVFDPEKACNSIDNLTEAIHCVGQSVMRASIGHLTYAEITSNRKRLNADVIRDVDSSIKAWGIDCTRVEIQNFRLHESIASKHHEMQMKADQKRRENEQDLQIAEAEASYWRKLYFKTRSKLLKPRLSKKDSEVADQPAYISQDIDFGNEESRESDDDSD